MSYRRTPESGSLGVWESGSPEKSGASERESFGKNVTYRPLVKSIPKSVKLFADTFGQVRKFHLSAGPRPQRNHGNNCGRGAEGSGREKERKKERKKARA
jgi:hypothetical protein